MNDVSRLTTAQYDEMIARGAFVGIDKRIELICGEIRQVNPAGPIHFDLIDYLARWSIENCDKNKVTVRVQGGLSFPELQSRPEPDVAWLKANRYMHAHPQANDVILLIEVSDSSLEFDRNEKAQLYSRAGIMEYWTVDVPDEVIHLYRQPHANGYQSLRTLKCGEHLSPIGHPKAVLSVSELLGHQE